MEKKMCNWVNITKQKDDLLLVFSGSWQIRALEKSIKPYYSVATWKRGPHIMEAENLAGCPSGPSNINSVTLSKFNFSVRIIFTTSLLLLNGIRGRGPSKSTLYKCKVIHIFLEIEGIPKKILIITYTACKQSV